MLDLDLDLVLLPLGLLRPLELAAGAEEGGGGVRQELVTISLLSSHIDLPWF